MNLLVTAGNTQALIDRVRCITNIFSGRTGAAIALHAHERGHDVTLLTSHPEAVRDLLPEGTNPLSVGWSIHPYRTFEDLAGRLADLIRAGGFDAVVHCAAVSDYLADGVFAPAPGTTFHREQGRWESSAGQGPALLDRQAGKVKSNENELWVRLVRAPKLIDRIRQEWDFRGLLVKFKLEVGISDDELLALAEPSRRQSGADLMVANTLENVTLCAFLGPIEGQYEHIPRGNLARRLLETLEKLHQQRTGQEVPHG
jgi:phosphopantothenoylcysteine synthetase/decarboxylase